MPVPERPIFVLGCPRSGTTMFQLMLHRHPRIAVPPETRFLMRAYRRHDAFGDLGDKDNRRKLGRWIMRTKGTKVRDLGLERRAVVRQVVEAPPTLGSCLAVPFQAYARRFEAPRWGDKYPSHYMHVPALLRMFPDAQFVHLVRDGRDAVASLRRMPWYKGDIAGAVAIWAEAMDYGERNARRLRADQWHELRYEDLVTDPEPVLRRLCAFLGEDYDPGMCRPDQLADIAVPQHKHWHARTHENPNAAAVGGFATSLAVDERVLAEYVLGGRLRAHGYDVPRSGPRPSPSALASYARTAVRRRVAHRRLGAADRWRDFRAGRPLAALPPDC